MSKETLDVVAIGNAMVDVLSKTSDAFIAEHQLVKNSMTLIEAEQADALYAQMPAGVEMSGGSAANTIAALASMGAKTGYIGKVANDQLGQVFRHDITAAGVRFTTGALQDGAPTARCLIMITPDAQRTMCTYLGACVWLMPSDLDAAMIADAQITYLEGYLFDRPHAKQTFYKACEIAHAAGRKVALSLSDSFCVERHRDEFLDLIKNHVDLLFANEAEIMSLYKGRAKTAEEAVTLASADCALVAVTRGPQGSIVAAGSDRVFVEAVPVDKVVDTTGAGDLYAAGFLYGYTHGFSLRECGELGSAAASDVIAHVGTRAQSDLAAMVKSITAKKSA